MKKYTWFQTFTGRKFDFANPTPEMIDLKDIARGLARIPRFMAQTNIMITVAEHSMYVADNVPDEFKLEALLHDAAEAYTGDIPSPLKALIGKSFKVIESNIEFAIATRFRLQYPWPEAIKAMDSHALYNEAGHLFTRYRPIESWNLHFKRPEIMANNTRLWKKVNGENPSAKALTEEFLDYATTLLELRCQAA